MEMKPLRFSIFVWRDSPLIFPKGIFSFDPKISFSFIATELKNIGAVDWIPYPYKLKSIYRINVLFPFFLFISLILFTVIVCIWFLCFVLITISWTHREERELTTTEAFIVALKKRKEKNRKEKNRKEKKRKEKKRKEKKRKEKKLMKMKNASLEETGK